jgi:putative restriction endonuclease
MKIYVGVTDNEWFDYLSRLPEINEVNFWQPTGDSTFKSLKPGELFLFKLHSPRGYIFFP